MIGVESKYFQPISKRLLEVEDRLTNDLDKLQFKKPVELVYNPLKYAKEPHSLFVRMYCNGTKPVLMLGLNPGPWGMAQTGVPFGEISSVRDWLKITGYVGKPEKESQQRRILGFECHRTEVSGQRFWSLWKQLAIDPEKLFKNSFIYNYCPLLFTNATGRNITPVDLRGTERDLLLEICDKYLVEVLKLLKVDNLIAIGRFCEKRALKIIKEHHLNIKIHYLPHPSPRVIGNERWVENTLELLKTSEIKKCLDL